MGETKKPFTLRLPDEQRAALKREADKLGLSASAYAENLLTRALRDPASEKLPRELRTLLDQLLERSDPTQLATTLQELRARLERVEADLARIDVNLYNAVVLGASLAAGEEKLKSSGPWLKKHIRSE